MQDLIQAIQHGELRQLARFITQIENDVPGYEKILAQLFIKQTPLIGITGPPGAGKSTLINSLVTYWLNLGKKVAVVAIDPSSPFKSM